MLAIKITFITGRFHATPWGRHVNEGVAEWPISPWRFLRSLVASWFKNNQQAHEVFTELLKKLAKLPSFYLPPATQANTQHYMPIKNISSLVFDTFVLMNRGAKAFIIWPDVQLSERENQLLDYLLFNVGYLGRAESWVEMERTDNHPEINAFPARSCSSEGLELTRVLAAQENEGLLQNLQYDTQTERMKGIFDPPGSQWVQYARPLEVFSVRQPQWHLDEDMVQVVRFALRSKPMPPVTETIHLGELARISVLSIFGRQNQGRKSAALSGKDSEGRLLEAHQHAHYLATDEDRDGRLDHLTIYVPKGMKIPEKEAVMSLRVLNPGNGEPETELFLLGSSFVEDTIGLPFSSSKTWVSVTPFVLGRFPKYTRSGKPKCRKDGTQIDGPIDQIYREWSIRRSIDSNLPELLRVEPVQGCHLKGRTQSWASFRIWRKRGVQTKIPGLAYGFRLYFSELVSGPVLLGYGSHFGLGQFFPEEVL